MALKGSWVRIPLSPPTSLFEQVSRHSAHVRRDLCRRRYRQRRFGQCRLVLSHSFATELGSTGRGFRPRLDGALLANGNRGLDRLSKRIPQSPQIDRALLVPACAERALELDVFSMGIGVAFRGDHRCALARDTCNHYRLLEGETDGGRAACSLPFMGYLCGGVELCHLAA